MTRKAVIVKGVPFNQVHYALSQCRLLEGAELEELDDKLHRPDLWYEQQCNTILKWQKRLGIQGSYEPTGLVCAIVAMKDKRIKDLEDQLSEARAVVRELNGTLGIDQEY